MKRDFIFCFIFTLVASDQMLKMANEEDIPIECHSVVTEDGYILRLYHLLPETNNESNESNGSNEGNSTKNTPMFLMHGLLASSPLYILYPQRSAGYFFRDRGYDVWIGNARGNTFSRNHTTLNPDETQFWKFSWHEIGVYDLPAMIDFVLSHTGHDKLVYVGHSQGVTSAFVMLSERPEYNKKIALLHAMTPPIYFKYYNPSTPSAIKDINELEGWVQRTNNYEILRFDDFKKLSRIIGELCLMTVISSICGRILGILMGPASPNSYEDRILLDCSEHLPSGSGYRQIMHYIQLFNSGRFHKFDHGPNENIRLYGSSKPPDYNFSNIETKVHILYGTNDYLAMAKNIPILLKEIKYAVVAVHKFNNFNHLDFVYGRQVHNVQKIILDVTKQHITPEGIE